MIIGHFEVIEIEPGEITKEKRNELIIKGVSRPDLSNYRHGRLNKISKQNLKIIQEALGGDIICKVKLYNINKQTRQLFKPKKKLIAAVMDKIKVR